MITYFHHKVALVNVCDVYGANTVQCVTHGIKDDAIQAGIRAVNFENPDQLRLFLAKYDTDSSRGKGSNSHHEKKSYNNYKSFHDACKISKRA